MQQAFNSESLEVITEPDATQAEEDSDKGNKAAAIRNALKVLPNDSKNEQIINYVFQEYGIRVSPPYVNTVRNQIKKRIAGELSFEALRLARKLIKECGDVASAKAALEGVTLKDEQEKSVVATYLAKIAEIELILGDESRKLSHGDKNDLMKEKLRFQKIVKVLEES